MNSKFHEGVSFISKKTTGNTNLLAHVFEPVELPSKLKVLGGKFGDFNHEPFEVLNPYFSAVQYSTVYLTCAPSLLYQLFESEIKVPTLQAPADENFKLITLKKVSFQLKGEFEYSAHKDLYTSLAMLKINLDSDVVVCSDVLGYLKENFESLLLIQELESETTYYKHVPLKVVDSKLSYLSPQQQKEFVHDLTPCIHYRSYMPEKSVETDSEFDCLQDLIIQQQLRLIMLKIFAPLFQHYHFQFNKRNAKLLLEKAGNFVFKVLIANKTLDDDKCKMGIAELYWMLIEYGILLSTDTLDSSIDFSEERGANADTSSKKTYLSEAAFINRSKMNTELGFCEIYPLLTILTNSKHEDHIPQIDHFVANKMWKELASFLEEIL